MTTATLYSVLVATCLLAGVVGVIAWPRREARAVRLAWQLSAWLTAGLAIATWVARWVEAGHLPLFGTYESALSLCVALLVTVAIWGQLQRERAAVVPVVCLIAAAVAGHGIGFDSTPYALTISERSWVVDVHAVAAWLAFAVLGLNAAVAVRVLALRGDPAAPSRWLETSLHWGFVLHTLMMASGSFYKFLLFGKAWSFDPIETLGFVAWVSYGTLLHLNIFAGYKGRKLAGWSLFLFVLLVVSYRGIVYFPSWSTYHILDMDLRMHIPG